MNYKRIRSVLFRLDPELSHKFSLNAIKLLYNFGLSNWITKKPIYSPKKVWDLTFPNPVGLAAGFDKNGEYIDALAALGFGFIEVGTVTPRPQAGNPKPRIFRLEDKQAIINRLGFNNKGVDYLISKLKNKQYSGILGINIGKNASTALETAVNDYIYCLNKVYPYASYIAVNISSPNTVGLRDLQSADYLSQFLDRLKEAQARLANQYAKYVPLLVKVAPDLTNTEIGEMAEIFCEKKVDGIIATNTTLDRTSLQGHRLESETGGLSGEPLFQKSTEVLRRFKQMTKDTMPIIAVGGILSPEQAADKIAAGADLIQLYSGLIYEGPELIAKCCRCIIQRN
jgi:dihydroorotate dehydrogenase